MQLYWTDWILPLIYCSWEETTWVVAAFGSLDIHDSIFRHTFQSRGRKIKKQLNYAFIVINSISTVELEKHWTKQFLRSQISLNRPVYRKIFVLTLLTRWWNNKESSCLSSCVKWFHSRHTNVPSSSFIVINVVLSTFFFLLQLLISNHCLAWDTSTENRVSVEVTIYLATSSWHCPPLSVANGEQWWFRSCHIVVGWLLKDVAQWHFNNMQKYYATYPQGKGSSKLRFITDPQWMIFTRSQKITQ